VRLKSLRATTQREEKIMGQKDIDIADLVGAYPTCSTCGSRDVVRDSWSEWNFAIGEWVLKSVFEHHACDKCGGETKPVWKLDKEFRKKRIRRLNDALRRCEGENTTVVITAGLQARGEQFVEAVCIAVASFDDFSGDNDPHKEHDFGAIDLQGEKLFWKIDYYDQSMTMLSPDPASPTATRRVLTIMLASEY
jgi:hypothetical protein